MTREREPGLVHVSDTQRRPLAQLLLALPDRARVVIENGTGLMAACVELVADLDLRGSRRAFARVDPDGTPSSSGTWPVLRTADEPLVQAARTRSSDPATSRDAAASTRPLTPRHRAVLAVFRWADRTDRDGLVDPELIAAYEKVSTHPRASVHAMQRHGLDGPLPPQTDQSLRSRRAELVRSGYLAPTEQKRRAHGGGRPHTVWTITPKGRTTTP